MVHQTTSNAELDRTFGALADPTRRAILLRLGQGPAALGELAEGFPLTLTGLKKHVQVLEAAGLVQTEKIGRVRWCRAEATRLAPAAAWIERYQEHLNGRLDRLEAFLREDEEET